MFPKFRSKQICAICYDNEYIIYTRLPCGHKFHRKCIKPWASRYNSCPICRKAIDNTRPIVRCRADTSEEDLQLAIRIQAAEYEDEDEQE